MLVDPTATTGRKHDRLGAEASETESVDVGSYADASTALKKETGDKASFKDGNIGVIVHGFYDGAFNFPTRFISVLNDAMSTVPPFFSEREFFSVMVEICA